MFDWSKECLPIYIDKWTDECYNKIINLLDNENQVCIFLKMQLQGGDELNSGYVNEKTVGQIISSLGKQEYIEGYQYIIIQTPNVKGFYNA